MTYSTRNRTHKRMVFRRKLQILRFLTKSNSAKTTSIIKDAFLHITALQLKLEILKREAMLKKHIDQLPNLLDVEVEKLGKNGFRLRVKSHKRRDNLVYILQAFEEMGIDVIQAKVSSNSYFVMEAIAQFSNADEDHQTIDPTVLTEVILKAIEKGGSS